MEVLGGRGHAERLQQPPPPQHRPVHDVAGGLPELMAKNAP